MRAVRNAKLCTKDCLCLYVCPTGATDTETGQIDATKCVDGCRICVDACPSNAISLVPSRFPQPREKDELTCSAMQSLAQSKLDQEQVALHLHKKSTSASEKEFLKGVATSNRIMAEDIIRESGYLLPQSSEVIKLLKGLISDNNTVDFPTDIVETLIKKL